MPRSDPALKQNSGRVILCAIIIMRMTTEASELTGKEKVGINEVDLCMLC